MKYFCCFLLLLSFFSFGQNREDTLKAVFKLIAKADQRFTSGKFVPDNVRDEIYEVNLDLISQFISKGDLSNKQFVQFDIKTQKEIRKASKITFFHILKYCPELILNEKFISFLEQQIKTNDFSTNLILPSLGFYYFIMTYNDDTSKMKKDFYTAKIMNHSYDFLFYDAIKRWNIDINVLSSSIKIVI